jgi:hypothetical protein
MAARSPAPEPTARGDLSFVTHQTHESHPHVHDRLCGHPAVGHDDHTDYLHDGHVHHVHDDHVDDVAGGAAGLHIPHRGHMHVHAPDCGHPAVKHGDHIDFVHGDHHHVGHATHYDEH